MPGCARSASATPTTRSAISRHPPPGKRAATKSASACGPSPGPRHSACCWRPASSWCGGSTTEGRPAPTTSLGLSSSLAVYRTSEPSVYLPPGTEAGNRAFLLLLRSLAGPSPDVRVPERKGKNDDEIACLSISGAASRSASLDGRHRSGLEPGNDPTTALS